MINYYTGSPKVGTYSLSYKDLEKNYTRMCGYSDVEFLKRLPEALHLAYIICWFKETPTDYCLGDEGVIHEIVHLLHLGKKYQTASRIRRIRKSFKDTLKLA